MLKYGGSGAQQKIIHPEVFQWKKELQRFVFACWYRGDAGSTISSNLVWGMNFIANTCQIPVNLTENPECTTKDGIFHQRSYYLQLRPGFMVDNAVEFGCVSGKPLAVTKRRVANDMVGGEMTSCLKKIIKLKLQEAIPVYNFSVEEDESYIANGLVVHNCSIVSSVATQPNGYRIIEPCDELVNANGNAWTNQVLPFCFKTFIGGYNFVEHVQIPELSKGCILDAVLRPVIHVGKNGKKATVLICDILVATERRFEDLISRIEGGSLSTLSMGALCNVAQCSYCGKIVKDNDENCNHIEKHLGDYIEDDTGVWKVAELVGAMDANGKYIEDSCIFIEASWVEQPAFEGAVMNYMINSPQFKSNLVMGEDSRLAMLFESEKTFKKLKVADKRSVMSIKITNDYFKDLKFANIVKKVALGK